jgi:hypothetical protein
MPEREITQYKRILDARWDMEEWESEDVEGNGREWGEKGKAGYSRWRWRWMWM